MALPINIKELLTGKTVEWERLDFKQGWNPEDVLHSACAFANDIHNWGGGYIIVGIDEQNGVPVLPPMGISLHTIDDIQKDLVRICSLVQPTVNVLAEPIEFMGKMILIIYVPGGEVRPYKAPKALGKEELKAGKLYYIRKGSVTKIANQDEERMLMSLCNKVPFDDRNMHFLATMPIHKAFMNERAYLASLGKELDENEPKGEPKENCLVLTERQRLVVMLIKADETISREEMSRKISVSLATVKREIKELQIKGIISREGGRKDGRWVIHK